MNNTVKVLEIIMPIFVTIALGMLARKKNTISEEANRGFQQFIMSFCLPCVLFNSCLTGNFGMESLTSMVLLMPLIFLSSLWSFKFGRKIYPYHNFPQMFSAQETGMLGIPLFMTLFGSAQAYRMGMLDLAQNMIAIPVIAILSANTGKNPSPAYVLKKVITSPLLLMSLLGLTLNLTGAMEVLNGIGIGTVITEVTGFVAQPVSAVILFCVGYNFSMEKGNRKRVFEICALHLAIFAGICLIIQAALCVIPSVDIETRWAVLLYCALPGSYLAAGLGKTKEESAIAASVCSLLTVTCLFVFCVITVIVA